MFTVEKTIPVPGFRGNKGYSDTIRKLGVGDSVLFPDATRGTINALCSNILGAGNYTTRKSSEGIRVWRTDKGADKQS